MSEVTITLDGDDVALRCTPGALRTLCTKYGDLATVQRRVSQFDYFVMCDVVEAGIGTKQMKDLEIKRDQLQDKVYEAGIVSLMVPLTNYTSMLANGGRELDSAAPEGGDEGNA